MSKTLNEIVDKLLTFEETTIITHIRPDGDTLGSAYALYHALKKIGKKAYVVCDNEISPRYRFLSNEQSTIRNECKGNIVCIDIAAPGMAGKSYCSYAENADIVIDHHPTNSGYGKLNLIRPEAAACGEIVYDLICKLCDIDKTIANCLYTAISTDTGCFVYSNTTAYTHKVAGKLIEVGADISTLNKKLFRTKSHAAFEIERRSLDSLEYFHDNKIACMVIKSDWMNELNATEDDIEGLSSIPNQIEGIEASATFKQISTNEYKLSVRSSSSIDASLVCKSFGGGGHKMAAGCTMVGSYDELKQIMADKLFEVKE